MSDSPWVRTAAWVRTQPWWLTVTPTAQVPTWRTVRIPRDNRTWEIR